MKLFYKSLFHFFFWAVFFWPWLHRISMFVSLSVNSIHALLGFLSALHVLVFCFRLQPQPIAIEEPLLGGGWAFRRGARGGRGEWRGQRGREKNRQGGAIAGGEGGLSGEGRLRGASGGFGGERRGLAPEECLRDWPQVTRVEASTCRVLLTRPRSTINSNFLLRCPCKPVTLALLTPTFTLL